MRGRGVTTLYVIGIGRLLSLPSPATTKAEPLGLEMDANPVTKGAAGPREEESEQNIRNTEVGRCTSWTHKG